MGMIRKSKMGFVHWVLIAANTIIITGGSYLSAQLSKDVTPSEQSRDENIGKGLRVAGTACFLALVQLYLFWGLQTAKRQKDTALWLIIGTWPFLTVRGVFGIVQVLMPAYSYYNPAVYSADGGLSPKFIAGEYLGATTMEWVSCGLLLGTYFCSGNDVANEESEEARREKEELEAKKNGVDVGSPNTLTGEQEGKKEVA